MRFPWQKENILAEEARKQRGKLAEAVIRNDRVRSRLSDKTREAPISDLLNGIFANLDGARRD